MKQTSHKMPAALKHGKGPTLTQLATIGAAANKILNDIDHEATKRTGIYAKRDRSPARPLTSKDVMPFVRKIISTHKRRPARGMKRCQVVVRMLGLTFTKHIDVPENFTV